jgi:3',5'-cyclic AMP phosphodiesterase CpdA
MLTLGHISDPHLGRTGASLDRLWAVVDELGTVAGLDAVVATGDLSEHGTAEGYRQFVASMARRPGLPWIACPGNHDVRAVFRTELLGLAGDAPVVSHLDVGGVRIVALDSMIPGRIEGALSPEVVREAGILIGSAPGPVLLALHHPPLTLGRAPTEPWLTNPDALAGLISGHQQVRGCLHGHLHGAMATTFAGRPLVGAPGIVSALVVEPSPPLFSSTEAAPGLAIHVLTGDGVLNSRFHHVTPSEVTRADRARA